MAGDGAVEKVHLSWAWSDRRVPMVSINRQVGGTSFWKEGSSRSEFLLLFQVAVCCCLTVP